MRREKLTLASVKAIRREEQEANERREASRKRAEQQWGTLDPGTRQRSAMVAAAFLLDEAGERELADWLLLARPERAFAVSTAVAVHALRRCLPAAWDVLMALDAADFVQAGDDYDSVETFIWSPGPGDLYEGE